MVSAKHAWNPALRMRARSACVNKPLIAITGTLPPASRTRISRNKAKPSRPGIEISDSAKSGRCVLTVSDSRKAGRSSLRAKCRKIVPSAQPAAHEICFVVMCAIPRSSISLRVAVTIWFRVLDSDSSLTGQFEYLFGGKAHFGLDSAGGFLGAIFLQGKRLLRHANCFCDGGGFFHASQ